MTGAAAGMPASLPVCVVIPLYNAAATIRRALDSVFRQTCLPAEIVLVDDASTDESWAVAQACAHESRAVPIRAHRLAANSGPGAARNAGWALATQPFIAFLDADDAWHPQKLDLQYRWLSRHPSVPMCGHRYQVVEGWPVAAPSFQLDESRVRRAGLGFLLVKNPFSTPTVMLRRDLKPRFATDKRHSEDYLLWVEIVAAHGAAALIDLPLAYLFKAPYGAGGLSGSLAAMRAGEVDTLRRLRDQNIIAAPTWALVYAWAWLKFCKRVLALRARSA